MYKLVNSCQNYLWGKKGEDNFVFKFFKNQEKETPSNQLTFAEYWMGTHPKSFSSVLDEKDQKTPLSEFLEKKGQAQIPYLFKILSIANCLSLQAHPCKELAEQLHLKDSKNYPDSNHKPEMAIALTDFLAFCDFCPVGQLVENYKRYPCIYEALKSHIDAFEGLKEEEVPAKLRALFESIPNLKEDLLKELKDHLETLKEGASVRDKVTADLLKTYPTDLTVISTLAFNLLELKKGDAFIMNPHEPHAYISGEIVEVMALSDNVVRLGLTPKFKDSETLMKMLTFKSGEKQLVQPLKTEKRDFVLTQYKGGKYEEFQCYLLSGNASSEATAELEIPSTAILANFGSSLCAQSVETSETIDLKTHQTGLALPGKIKLTVPKGETSEVFVVICIKNMVDINLS